MTGDLGFTDLGCDSNFSLGDGGTNENGAAVPDATLPADRVFLGGSRIAEGRENSNWMPISSSSSTRPRNLRGSVNVNVPILTLFFSAGANEEGAAVLANSCFCEAEAIEDAAAVKLACVMAVATGSRGSADVGGGDCSVLSTSIRVVGSSTSARWYFAHDSDVDGVGFLASRSRGFWILFSVDRIFSATAAEYALRVISSFFAPVNKRDGRGRRSRRSSRA